MAKLKETGWFPAGGQKPWEPGVYKTRFKSGFGALRVEGYSYYNGKRWGPQTCNKVRSSQMGGQRWAMQYKDWCGLAEDPGK